MDLLGDSTYDMAIGSKENQNSVEHLANWATTLEIFMRWKFDFEMHKKINSTKNYLLERSI